MIGGMTQTLGILALRIWRNESGQLRASVSAKFDAADSTAPKISYYTSAGELDAAVAAWVQRYSALTKPLDKSRP
jgi:hypothetical protein